MARIETRNEVLGLRIECFVEGEPNSGGEAVPLAITIRKRVNELVVISCAECRRNAKENVLRDGINC
jgi:hypothetical protein